MQKAEKRHSYGGRTRGKSARTDRGKKEDTAERVKGFKKLNGRSSVASPEKKGKTVEQNATRKKRN